MKRQQFQGKKINCFKTTIRFSVKKKNISDENLPSAPMKR